METKNLPDLNLSQEEINLLFSAITKEIPSGIILLSNGVIRYCNSGMLRLSGYNSEELVGKKYEILFDEDNARKINQFISEIEYRKYINIEVKLKQKDSSKIICILNAVLSDSLNTNKEIVCTFSDITERKKTEEKLKQSEEFHYTLLNAVSEALIGVDSFSKIVLFNTAAKFLFRRSTIECIGQSPEILFSGINKEIIQRYIDNIISSDFTFNDNTANIELEGITQDGEAFPVELSISPTHFQGKNLILLSIRDITRRKRYETALKQKKQEHEALLSNIPDLIYFKNSKFDYISANKAFCSFVRVNEKDINGKKDFDFYTEETARNLMNHGLEVFKQERSISNEEILNFNNGKSIYAIITRTPIFDDEKKPIGLVCISRDITERREKEIELQRFTRELEETKKSLERKTFELIKVNQDLLLSRSELEKYSAQLAEQNKILKESEIRLKSLNLQKDKFVSIISHDLRNPFTSILGHAELLQMMWEDTPDEKRLSYIGSIYNAAQHQLNQLNNLLEWAKFADGRIPFKPRLVLLNDVIKKSIEAFSGMKQKKNINIINNVDENIKILGDKNLLFRLSENMIGNALKFTPANGSIVLTTNFIEDSSQVFLSIKDSGIGIPLEILPTLFKLEGKISRTGTNGEPGTGLGLILCSEIVELHQGAITVDSKEGEGATFTMNLALASPEVLVLSDDDDLYSDISYCIKSLNKGYDSKKIEVFDEAVEHLDLKYPCLLIVDFSTLNKYSENVNEIFMMKKAGLLPVLILKDDEDNQEIRIPGKNIIQIFSKPIDRDNLTYNINRILL